MKGREEAEGRVLPQGRRKAAVTRGERRGGGKAVTASEEDRQLELISETAESPKGNDGGRDRGRPRPRTRAVPKSGSTKGKSLPAMTMEEVAREENLVRAFEKWRRTTRHRDRTGRRSTRSKGISGGSCRR